MKQQNEIITLNNELFGQVRVVSINDESYFIGKDVAEALGYKDTDQAVRKHVDDEDKLSRRIDGSRNMTVINESGVYSLIFGSKLESAKQFKRWVTSEILPTLRRSGVVVLEHAEPEAIDYQAKYGKYKIRKTFNESNDLRATYEEFAALSKIERAAKRIDNKDRIRSCKAIINVLEEKIANEVLTLRASELIAIQELIGDIQYDITKLSNKLNGGKKSAMTKQIAQLKDELNMTTNDYYEIPKHGFSVNYMYSYDEPNRKVCKSRAYQSWISKLNLNEYLPVELPNVSLEEPLRVSLCYICKESFDVENMNKSILDEVANYYNFNDNIISEVRSKRVGICDEYYDGKIYIKIENIEGYDDNE